MIIFVDVDGVVADLATCYSGNVSQLEDPALYDNMPSIPGALDGVNQLRAAGHRVVFATVSPNGSAGRKLRWLVDHGFLAWQPQPGEAPTTHPDYIEIKDKSLLRGDMLIDDGPHNIAAFRGTAILFRNWREVIDLVERIPQPVTDGRE